MKTPYIVIFWPKSASEARPFLCDAADQEDAEQQCAIYWHTVTGEMDITITHSAPVATPDPREVAMVNALIHRVLPETGHQSDDPHSFDGNCPTCGQTYRKRS